MNEKIAYSKSLGLINDFKDALGQQLYYWGCDVAYPKHNLLCEFGLKKYKSNGKGSKTCYRMKFQNDIIELHQLCIGRYSTNRLSFTFTRQYRRCWNYIDSKPPLPGYYNKELINTKSTEQIEMSSRKFAEWLYEYEIWISKNTPYSYRQHCFNSFKKIPKSKSWLHPDVALGWLQKFKDSPGTLERSKEWKRRYNATQ